MAIKRPLQPVDVATGLIAGSLAAAFLTLSGIAAAQTGDPAPIRPVDVDSAVSR